MTGSDLGAMLERRLYSLFVGCAVFGALVILIVFFATRSQKAVTPQPVTGFWKTITIKDGDDEQSQQAYFCPDGSYQGRIYNTNLGWWETYEGKDKKASYAEENQAKAAIEKAEPCE